MPVTIRQSEQCPKHWLIDQGIWSAAGKLALKSTTSGARKVAKVKPKLAKNFIKEGEMGGLKTNDRHWG